MLFFKRPDGAMIRVRNLTDQVFSLEDDETGWQYHWSVSEALERAEQNGSLEWISLSEMGVTAEGVESRYHGLDTEYAMTTDLTRPLLFVPFGDKFQLIDGHHRLYKACVLGVDELFAYFLNEKDAEACLVMKLPPGQGVDWGQASYR